MNFLSIDMGTTGCKCQLFNEKGEPTHLFCATGDGGVPYSFDNETYIVCIKLNKK